MLKYIVAGAVALALLNGAAVAQNVPSQNGTTPLVAPPVGTLSSSRTERLIDNNGTETDSSQTTYRNQAGVADIVHSTTTTHPASTTTTSSSNITTTH